MVEEGEDQFRSPAHATDVLTALGCCLGQVVAAKVGLFRSFEVLPQRFRWILLGRIPVTVMISSREEPEVVSSYQLGVNAYTGKPLSFHKFIEAI